MVFTQIDIKEKEGAGQQSIPIPSDFKIDDNMVYFKKVGNALFVIPFHNPWQSLVDSVEEFTADFMNEREQPVE